MNDLDAPKLTSFFSALAPGFLILFVRRQFTISIPKSFEDRAISYAAISAVYFAFSVPFFAFLKQNWNVAPEAYRALEYFALPIFLGLTFTWLTKKRPLDRWWYKFGLNPLHHIPSAWDFVFSELDDQKWIIVTLNDGSQVAGKYGVGSFASSDSNERDVYISEVWDIDEGTWQKPDRHKGVLLCGRDIKAVELISEPLEETEEPSDVGQEKA
ncbi:DUF6338 family protein [Hyphomonas sp. CACIAM 19H1]|uniref:DUF6338 family protein n=1 Tax=Hyphomonas sp. CACIAM 19H1 TaxID=1873716 RepID=UPI0013B05B90|nr:DUF6338 family protein [Hyphomonas sp. CACIAM 19H1]